MDQMPRHEDWDENGLPIGETPEQPAAREAREAESIARGVAELKAGYYLLEEEVDAWFAELERSPDAPMPVPPRRAPLL